jgi:YidC/Oxa1 family membrane protein insertase
MYEVILIFISNYGVGIIGLSCVTALILIPIEKAVRGSILKEKKVESVLQPQLTEIKHKYSGIDKNNAIKRLYTRYGYSPLYAIRNVYGVLIQLPFLIGAYLMLSSYDHLNGQSFLFIKDLSMQDQLLGKVNLLPILMTVVNLSTLLFLNLSKKENIQTGVIAFVFLILLYTAPSALLLYWTMNNVIHLLRAFWKKYIRFDIHKKKIIKYLKIAIEGISQTKIGYYLNNQLIEKTNREFFKKNWFVFLFLCCTLSLFINGFKNLGYYSPDDISRSIIFTSFLLIIISPFLYVIKNIGRNIKLFRLFFIIVILIFGSTYYYKTAGYIIVEDLPRFSRIISILSMFVIFYIIGGIKFVNIVLVVNVLLVVIFGVYNNYDSQKDFLSNIDETNKEDIVLNDRPNFYYILCESMNSLDIAITEYGFEKKYAEEFVDFLKNKGFYTPDYVYSNGSHTLKTLQTIFLMRDYIAGNKGNSDGSTSVRPMIAGSKYNKLLKILKNNGYYTSSYLPSQYFCSTKGPLLDFYDASELSNTTLQLAEGQPFLKNVVKTIAKKSNQ